MENYKIILAGIPRSGTTCLFRAMMGLAPASGSPKGNFAKSLIGYKTHALCPPESFGNPQAEIVANSIQNGAKSIFVFGNPLISIVSTYQNRFENTHASNCGCKERLSDINIFEKDWFNYERMFDSWHTSHNFPVLCIKYEYIWDLKEEIEHFVGFKFNLPPIKDRKTNMNILTSGDRKDLLKTYSSLYEKWAEESPMNIYGKV